MTTKLLQDLSECASKSGEKIRLDPAKVAAHARGMSKLLESALSESDSESREAIPFHIYLFALKALFYSNKWHRSIPCTLDLVTMIEFHRLSITGKVTTALECNEYYRQNQQGNVSMLSEKDEELFRHVLADQSRLREVFVDIIKSGCSNDLYDIWRRGSSTDFIRRWNHYCIPESSGSKHSIPPFYHGMSELEKKSIAESFENLHNTLRSEPLERGGKAGTPQSTQLVDQRVLGQSIESYFGYVQELIEEYDSTSSGMEEITQTREDA